MDTWAIRTAAGRPSNSFCSEARDALGRYYPCVDIGFEWLAVVYPGQRNGQFQLAGGWQV
jgi:hypothetical protein